MRVLVVEDDAGVSTFLLRGLREAGYSVSMAIDGQTALELACAAPHDIIVLDLMLPLRDGLSVLRELRARDMHTPVICLTARDQVDDRLKGLDLGADDYLTKPFSFPELLARMRAVLRRGNGLHANTIRIGDLSVDLRARRVSREGHRIDLSPTEYALLEYMARNAGHVLSRAMILDQVWDFRQDPLTNVVDVHVNRLRKKIDRGFETALIHTVRGVGYVFEERRGQD